MDPRVEESYDPVGRVEEYRDDLYPSDPEVVCVVDPLFRPSPFRLLLGERGKGTRPSSEKRWDGSGGGVECLRYYSLKENRS